MATLFGAFLMVGAVSVFLMFVVRLPSLWVPDYGERLSERGPTLSKANMNRGDFLIHFNAWIFQSRFRSALAAILIGYLGWCMCSGRPTIPV